MMKPNHALYEECQDVIKHRTTHLRQRDWKLVQDVLKRKAIDGAEMCKIKLESGTDDLQWLQDMLGDKYRVYKSKVSNDDPDVCTIMWRKFTY